MDIVFFGSGAFGLPTLQRLAGDHHVQAIVTQPDKPAGRGGQLTPTPIAAWAAQHLPHVPLFRPITVNEPGVREQLRAYSARTDGAWVVIAFGQKLGKALLDGVFSVNLHASLLPKWRGAAPINASILGGDTVTGNSIITLADKMDAGLVLGQSTRVIEPSQTAGELHDLLAADGPALMIEVLAKHQSRTLTPITQNESAVSIAPKMSKADGWIDFSNADACRRRIHGLTPWPGVTVQFRGEPLKILRAASSSTPASRSVPTACLADSTHGRIACADGSTLQLLEVQPAGKRAMSWHDFSIGKKPAQGELFTSTRHETSTPKGGAA